MTGRTRDEKDARYNGVEGGTCGSVRVAMRTIGEWRDGWYRIPYEVTWRDLDAVGHVNNANYFTFFESARISYWLDLFEIEDPGGRSIGFIVAHASCDFRSQLGLRDAIEIRVRIGEIRNSSFDFIYEIATGTGAVAATGKVVSVLFDWNRNERARVDDALRERIRRFQHEEGG